MAVMGLSPRSALFLIVCFGLFASSGAQCSTFAERCTLTIGKSNIGNLTSIDIANGQSLYFEVVVNVLPSFHSSSSNNFIEKIDSGPVTDVAFAMTVLYGDPDLFVGTGTTYVFFLNLFGFRLSFAGKLRPSRRRGHRILLHLEMLFLWFGYFDFGFVE
jgi:hypothetical protein